MNYCKHDVLLYFGKKKILTNYSICYERKYICAYCGSKNIINGSCKKEVIDISDEKINLYNNRHIYKKYNEIRGKVPNILKEEKLKNKVKTLVLK